MKSVSAPRLPCPPISTVETVLVFRGLNLGDMLCSVPAFRALRAGLPRARIMLLGLPWAGLFAARFRRYIDEFIEFPGYPGLPERIYDAGTLRFSLEAMRRRHYDLAVQMHGSGTVSNRLIASLGARFTAGFYPSTGNRPGPWFVRYPESLSEVDRNLSLVRFLGCPSVGEHLEFPILEEDSGGLLAADELKGLRRRSYVCIHPGANVTDKCWPIENFAAVAQSVVSSGLTVVITGNRRESDLAARISGVMEGGCIDSASLDLGLGSLALLIRNARLLVCNDTGVSHLASALEVPSVVVFTRTDPDRWAPFNRMRHRVVGGNGRSPSVAEVMNAVTIQLS